MNTSEMLICGLCIFFAIPAVGGFMLGHSVVSAIKRKAQK